MTIQAIPPDLENRIRVILQGPEDMRLILECTLCEDAILSLDSKNKVWICENCGVSTNAAELVALFQGCVDALNGDQKEFRPKRKTKGVLGRLAEEGLGKWREIISEEMRQHLKDD